MQHKGSSLPPLPLTAARTQTQDSHYQPELEPFPRGTYGQPRRQHWVPSELAARSAAFAGRHCGWVHSASPPSFRGHCGPSHTKLDMSQMQMVHLGRDSKDYVAWWTSRYNEGWFSGLVLLDSCGAHLLGQRNLQMAFGMEASGRREDNQEKHKGTIWATLIWCF